MTGLQPPEKSSQTTFLALIHEKIYWGEKKYTGAGHDLRHPLKVRRKS
jgi:hypothetical protein